MPILRYLQHWLTGRGSCLQVAVFVPETHPLRQWADTIGSAIHVMFQSQNTRNRHSCSIGYGTALACQHDRDSTTILPGPTGGQRRSDLVFLLVPAGTRTCR
jgi:hypothetical protein